MRKKTAKQNSCHLTKSKECFLRLIENSSELFYLTNAKTGKFEYVSPASTKITGFSPEEVMQMGLDGISRRVHPDNFSVDEAKFKQLIQQKTPVPKDALGYTEQKFLHKDGHWVWLGISRNLITDASGRPDAIVGTIRDITEVKTLQQQLEKSLRNYRELYDKASAALFRTRISDGKLLECNEAMVRMLGYKNREECLAKHHSVQHYYDLKQREELLKTLQNAGRVDNFEIKARRYNGQPYWMRLSARLNDDEGYIEGSIIDITASKILTKMENEILQLVMNGKSNKQIAAELGRSVRTVEEHRANIMRKLGATNLVELAQKAMNYGAAVQKQ